MEENKKSLESKFKKVKIEDKEKKEKSVSSKSRKNSDKRIVEKSRDLDILLGSNRFKKRNNSADMKDSRYNKMF